MINNTCKNVTPTPKSLDIRFLSYILLTLPPKPYPFFFIYIIFSNTGTINYVFGIGNTKMKNGLLIPILLSTVHRSLGTFYFSIYKACTWTIEWFSNCLLPTFHIFSIPLSARWLWHTLFNNLLGLMVN